MTSLSSYAIKLPLPFRQSYGITAALLFLSLLMAILFQMLTTGVCQSKIALIFIFSLAYWAVAGGYCYSLLRIKPLSPFALLLLGAGVVSLNQLLMVFGVELAMNAMYNCELFVHNWRTYLISNNLLINIICFTAFSYMGIREKHKMYSKVKADGEDSTERTIQFAFPEKVLIRDGATQFWVPVSEIVWVEVERNCITLVTVSKKWVLYQTLKSFSEHLNPSVFKQIHRSVVINTMFLANVKNLPSGDAIARMQNGVELKISRTFKQGLA